MPGYLGPEVHIYLRSTNSGARILDRFPKSRLLYVYSTVISLQGYDQRGNWRKGTFISSVLHISVELKKAYMSAYPFWFLCTRSFIQGTLHFHFVHQLTEKAKAQLPFIHHKIGSTVYQMFFSRTWWQRSYAVYHLPPGNSWCSVYGMFIISWLLDLTNFEVFSQGMS